MRIKGEVKYITYKGVFLLPLIELLLMDLGITISTLFRFNKIITIITNSNKTCMNRYIFFYFIYNLFEWF